MSILVIGSTNMDISVYVDHLPLKGETLLGKNICEEYGGKGANQACAAGKLGRDVTFLSCVGNDSFSQEIITYLDSVHVNVSKVKYSSVHKTGTALIHIDENGDNTIVVAQGANVECDVAYIRANEACFKECDIVLLQLEIPLKAVEEAIFLAAKYGKKVILNPAPANAELEHSLYPLIDYMIPNESELMQMSKEKEISKCIMQFIKSGIKNIIVTLGDQGALLYRQNVAPLHIPAYKVHAVDTVGAGDCFCGAFAAALDAGKTIEEATRFAASAAAVAVTRKGAQKAMPLISDILSKGYFSI